MFKTRRSRDRLIFSMEIPIPGKTILILRRDPGFNIAQEVAETPAKFRRLSNWKTLIVIPAPSRVCARYYDKTSFAILNPPTPTHPYTPTDRNLTPTDS